MKRGEFFGAAFKYALGKSVELLEDNVIVNTLEGMADEGREWVRPPGASKEDLVFRSKCTGCDACMIACPFNVVMIEDQTSRRPVVFDADVCLKCVDKPCINACSEGALV